MFFNSPSGPSLRRYAPMSISLTRALGSLVLLATSAACWWAVAGVTAEWARFSLITIGVVGALAGIGVLLVAGQANGEGDEMRVETAKIAAD